MNKKKLLIICIVAFIFGVATIHCVIYYNGKKGVEYALTVNSKLCRKE